MLVNTFVRVETLKKANKIMLFNAGHYDQYIVVEMSNGIRYAYPNTYYNQRKLVNSGREITEWHMNMN